MSVRLVPSLRHSGTATATEGRRYEGTAKWKDGGTKAVGHRDGGTVGQRQLDGGTKGTAERTRDDDDDRTAGSEFCI